MVQLQFILSVCNPEKLTIKGKADKLIRILEIVGIETLMFGN